MNTSHEPLASDATMAQRAESPSLPAVSQKDCWRRHVLSFAAIAFVGTVGLYFASEAWVAPPVSPAPTTTGSPAQDNATTEPKKAEVDHAGQPAFVVVHRFRLSSHDVKDSQERPDLAVSNAGHVFLAWASKTDDDERTILFTRKSPVEPKFAEPIIVSKGGIYRSGGSAFPKKIQPATGQDGTKKGKAATSRRRGGFERRATPHLGLIGDNIGLAWGGASNDGSTIQMLLAQSTDGGASFYAPTPVHRGPANATFTSLATSQGGAVACAWLGGPSGSQQVFASYRPAGAKQFSGEQLVYAGEDGQGVCPCCPTGVCLAADGTVYVAFRNISAGFRDISVSRLRPGQTSFEGPFPVTPHTWKVSGCPHDGPSLCVIRDTLHVVWMDARTGSPRCYHGWARVSDMKFTTRPLDPTAPGTQGNAKIVADKAGGLHAVWEASGPSTNAKNHDAGHQHGAPKLTPGSGRAIYHAYLAPGQKVFGRAKAVAAVPGAYQSRPSVAVNTRGEVWIAFNELDNVGKSIVVAFLQPAGK